jgi:hypothetical protein
LTTHGSKEHIATLANEAWMRQLDAIGGWLRISAPKVQN